MLHGGIYTSFFFVGAKVVLLYIARKVLFSPYFTRDIIIPFRSESFIKGSGGWDKRVKQGTSGQTLQFINTFMEGLGRLSP